MYLSISTHRVRVRARVSCTVKLTMIYCEGMQIIPIQECISNTDGPMSVPVHSNSNPRLIYDVLITDSEDPTTAICACPGYEYRGYCRHQREAFEKICGWTDLTGPEVQTPEQHANQVCPRCGDDTRWTMEAVDDEDTK